MKYFWKMSTYLAHSSTLYDTVQFITSIVDELIYSYVPIILTTSFDFVLKTPIYEIFITNYY